MAGEESALMSKTTEPSISEMSAWENHRIALRAAILALVCVDRKDKKDAAYDWANEKLDEMVPLINKKFLPET